jgi:hypothetical protein
MSEYPSVTGKKVIMARGKAEERERYKDKGRERDR